MCGILGFLSRSSEQNIDLLPAIKLLNHRGPDDSGIWKDSFIQIAHTRLSILDLSPMGHQPMSYQDGRFWITFNGEIYNYLELREELASQGHQFVTQTDTEVLLAAYAQWGLSCLDRFRGMFAFGIWDTHCKTLFLARDRVGEKPLYYSQNSNGFYFSSELKALISLLPQLPNLDPVAVDLYLHYQYTPEPRTPLLGVKKLPAGHYLLINYETWEVDPQCYWDLDRIAPMEGDPIELIREELDRVIELTLRSDVPVGIALSGGIDSSAIAALAAPKYKDRLQAFSVGYPGHPKYDERVQAKEFATQLGLSFNDIELRTENFAELFPDLVAAMDDPIADIAAYGHYAVMKLAADSGVKVMLSGIGGDELFWGYSWATTAVELTQQKQELLKQPIKAQVNGLDLVKIANSPLYQRIISMPLLPTTLQSWLKQIVGTSQLSLNYPEQAVYYDRVPDFISALQYCSQIYTNDFNARIPDRNPYYPFQLNLENSSDLPIQIIKILFNTWLVSNCLSLGDRVSMASSVETRLPLLDYKLIELTIGCRRLQSDHQLGSKFWLKSALNGILPDKILNRRKRGFQPPIKEWMDAVLQKYMVWLEKGYLVDLMVIDAIYLSKMIRDFQSSKKHRFMLYKLLVLETWYRKVVLSKI
jgi:asparagine synthase (glutamine-hydrolysing)